MVQWKLKITNYNLQHSMILKLYPSEFFAEQEHQAAIYRGPNNIWNIKTIPS